MKITANWLREYCDSGLSAEDLAHRLSMSGCLIEETAPLGDDTLMVAEVTANRPDLLGVIGIAREVSALTGAPLQLPPVDFEESDEQVSDATSVEVQAPDLCPRYTARVIRGVRVGPSPDWLVRRLEAVGVRPVNNVVDVTNFVMLECGQPLHAFDFDKLRGGKIVVRRGVKGEVLVSIDETKCKLDPSMLIIADAERPVAIAGVMGGLDTEISPRTVNVLLESAHFENTNIRRTSRGLGLASESSYRFERGIDPVQTEWASRRAAWLIREVAGGSVCEGVADVWAAPYEPKKVTLRVPRMCSLLGVDVPEAEARRILDALGFAVQPESSDGKVVVAVPPFRARDVSREADLIEEVIRVYGYDKIPETCTLDAVAGAADRMECVETVARNALVGAGFYEALTNSFCDETTARLVSPWTDNEPLRFHNAVRSQENRLRVSLMPGLLAAKRVNVAHGVRRSPLFEISRVFLPKADGGDMKSAEDEARPEERVVLALLAEESLMELKGVVEKILDTLGIAGAAFEAAPCAFFKEGLAGRIVLDGATLGILGEVSQAVADRFDLPRSPVMAELDFALLTKHAALEKSYKKLPAQPAAVRDLAVVLDEDVAWASVEQALTALALPILRKIEFFDVFRGKQVPKGRKSIALSLTFRAPDRTLTSEEVEDARQACIGALEKLGGELRK